MPLNFKQAFYSLCKLCVAWLWQHKNTFVQAFHSVPGCQTCMCKRGIRFGQIWLDLGKIKILHPQKL